MKNRFMPGVVIAVLGLPLLANGCSDDGSNPLSAVCCTDYKPGSDVSSVDFGVDASIKGEFSVFAQAGSDFSATATAAANDVATACRAIAVDLGADPDGANKAGKTGRDALSFWCDQAVAQITANFGAGGKFAAAASLKIAVEPARCEASISATADCQAKCTVEGSCDIKATPPTCKGGTLTVDCSGSCDVTAQEPKISCTGSCQGSCEGACEASVNGAVQCDGTCEGTCAASGGANTGPQADGSCKGTCNGKCTARAGVSATCSGTCSGKCTGKCSASPGGVSAKCSGKCDAQATPLTCEGGTLEGGCNVSADCKANCSASVSAKAECTPPSITIVAGAGLNGKLLDEYRAALRSLEANLPNLLLVLQARGQAFIDTGKAFVTAAANIAASGNLGIKGTACGVVISASVVEASKNAEASVGGSVKVAGALKIGG